MRMQKWSGPTHLGTGQRPARPCGVPAPGPDSRDTDIWRPCSHDAGGTVPHLRGGAARSDQSAGAMGPVRLRT